MIDDGHRLTPRTHRRSGLVLEWPKLKTTDAPGAVLSILISTVASRPVTVSIRRFISPARVIPLRSELPFCARAHESAIRDETRCLRHSEVATGWSLRAARSENYWLGQAASRPIVRVLAGVNASVCS